MYYYGQDLETCNHGLDKSPQNCIGLLLFLQAPALKLDIIYNRARFLSMKENVIFQLGLNMLAMCWFWLG